MPESAGFDLKQEVWLGPQVMTSNGLELHAVVVEDTKGRFHAGTRYGPEGSTAPEFGHEDFFSMPVYKDKDAAILAAKADVAESARQCGGHTKTEALLDSVAAPKRDAEKPAARPRQRTIDR